MANRPHGPVGGMPRRPLGGTRAAPGSSCSRATCGMGSVCASRQSQPLYLSWGLALSAVSCDLALIGTQMSPLGWAMLAALCFACHCLSTALAPELPEGTTSQGNVADPCPHTAATEAPFPVDPLAGPSLWGCSVRGAAVWALAWLAVTLAPYGRPLPTTTPPATCLHWTCLPLPGGRVDIPALPVALGACLLLTLTLAAHAAGLAPARGTPPVDLFLTLAIAWWAGLPVCLPQATIVAAALAVGLAIVRQPVPGAVPVATCQSIESPSVASAALASTLLATLLTLMAITTTPGNIHLPHSGTTTSSAKADPASPAPRTLQHPLPPAPSPPNVAHLPPPPPNPAGADEAAQYFDAGLPSSTVDGAAVLSLRGGRAVVVPPCTKPVVTVASLTFKVRQLPFLLPSILCLAPSFLPQTP
eukprot:gene2085-3048_t